MSVSETKSWAAVEFEVAADNEELAGWAVMDGCGATACEVKPLDNGLVLIHATFDRSSLSPEEVVQIRAELSRYGVLGPCAKLRTCAVAQEDWLAKFKAGFKPFPVGERLLVSPPWEAESAKSSAGTRKLLVVEPGMAFGTGLHATTQFCLRSLETEPIGHDILDIGTGSAILAIAAILLEPGAHITAIDHDPTAIEVAAENCRLNGVEGKIRLLTGSMELVEGQQFDSILSNLTCEAIVSLLPSYKRVLRPGGTVVCAGVLAEKLPLLEKGAAEHGFRVKRTEPEGTWCGVILCPA
jgi:ribosomal protein L11 methyltransferase